MADGSHPDWDMTPYFTGLDAPAYRDFFSTLKRDLASLRQRAEALPPPSAAVRADWVALLGALEDAQLRLGHLRGYLSCRSAADATDEAIQRAVASLEPLRAEQAKAWVAVRAGLRETSDAEMEALVAAPELAHARYFLGRMRALAARAMAPELEGLAADLGVTGLSAWGRLYGQVSGRLTFDLELPHETRRDLPISMTRTLLEDPDPDVRRAALAGANRSWQRVGDTMAACLNAISGTRLALYERRGIPHFLDPALFDAAIERETLDTMLAVVRERRDVAWRYLRHKAGLLGLPKLAFHDLLSPLPRAGKPEARVPWEQGRDRVLDAFGAFHPELRTLAARAFDERWIDHSPRSGKRPGGFCSTSMLLGQSRIFLTYSGASGDVRTLAHELGHAFHGWVMRDMRPWQRGYPMTLAETASTFAEQILADALLDADDVDAQARAATADHLLADAATFLCNIPMRFDFEHQVYSRRAAGELSVTELCQIMLDTQREHFGDALDPEQLDPWYWASKLHFYLTDISFYNFPYTFGYLFSQGVFARAKQEGAAFLPRYQALLRATGSASAEEVAREALGVELGAPDFWHASIDRIEADLERFIATTTPAHGS